MKFTLFALTLAMVSNVLADESVKIYVQSDNSELSGKGISSIHEGAGINYFFLGNGAQELTYTDSALTSNQIGYPQEFSVETGYVQMTVGDSSAVITFSDEGVLQINGSEDGFYACKNTKDPYHYSTSSYEVMFGNSIGDCTPIKLTKVAVSSVSSSSASSAASASSQSASISSVSSASSQSVAPYANSTLTTKTFTDGKTKIETVTCPKCTATPTESLTTVTTVNSEGKTETVTVPCSTTESIAATESLTTVTTVNSEGKTETVTIPCPTNSATEADNKTVSATTAPIVSTPVTIAPTISTKTNTSSCEHCTIATYQGAANVAKPAGFAVIAIGLVGLVF